MTSEPLNMPFLAVSRAPVGLRTLIVGAGQAGRALARDLQRVDRFGLTPIGFLDDDASKRTVRHLPVLGGLNDLLTVATAQRVDVVVLAIPGCPKPTSPAWRPQPPGSGPVFVGCPRSSRCCSARSWGPTCAHSPWPTSSVAPKCTSPHLPWPRSSRGRPFS